MVSCYCSPCATIICLAWCVYFHERQHQVFDILTGVYSRRLPTVHSASVSSFHLPNGHTQPVGINAFPMSNTRCCSYVRLNYSSSVRAVGDATTVVELQDIVLLVANSFPYTRVSTRHYSDSTCRRFMDIKQEI